VIIKSIHYKNFRNFEKEGRVLFDTSGKLTIVYGSNGDGKTTLHQMFQWILYGDVNFNKTTTKKLYNLDAAEQVRDGAGLAVWGEIEFTHNNEDYLVRREWRYEKTSAGNMMHKSEYDDFFVQKKDETNHWSMLEDPKFIVESLIPSGLAPYFFFDGETMIADLKIRGTDSAKKLKNALNSLFDLELYENAISHLGDPIKKPKRSVIGELIDKKEEVLKKAVDEKDYKENLRQLRMLRAQLEKDQLSHDAKISKKKDNLARITEISEEIGKRKSTKELEKSRQEYKQLIKEKEKGIVETQKKFGSETANNFTYLLLGNVAKEASERLYLEVEEEKKKIIPGLSKELLINLLLHDNCICGNTICEKEKEELLMWKSFFPPASYKATYDRYQRYMNKYAGKYNPDGLVKHIKQVVEYKNKIREYATKITELDDSIAKNGNIDDLVEERKELEASNRVLENDIAKLNGDITTWNRQITAREKRRDEYKGQNNEADIYQSKIDLVCKVVNEIKLRMTKETDDYVEKLRDEIQSLIEEMLTSERDVTLSHDFQFQVKDNHGDESKSEGQFAVISFAYIVGILKVLKMHDKLAQKEYPLVLDGPFSKLDPVQKKNVINTIPQYVPQVIIFSKDPLYDVVSKSDIGAEWTICSNKQKNNATIKEGYLWK